LKVLVQIYKDVPQRITSDKHRLKHVMDNLLSNAIQVCPDDSDICLSMSYQNKFKDSVTFAVRDQGPGITNEDMKLLFQPFMVVRPGELHSGRGSGLGLSISRHTVELHAGSLDCASTMRMDNGDITSGGTELSFTVPVDSSSNVVHDDDGALPMLHPSSDSMTCIMSCEMLIKKDRYSKCDEDRSLQVLVAARVLSEQQLQQQEQQLTTQTETVSRALDMSEKLVDVLIDQGEVRKTERILIVDGRLTMQACCMHWMMRTH
jgi:phosphoglycerate-specific signal transduction histidine kinase